MTLQRTMFQLYLKGCDEAIELYKKAFDAEVGEIHRNIEDGTVMHAEMNAFGQCVAFSERKTETMAGNTMQMCFHFGGEESDKVAVREAYEVLKDGADVHFPLGFTEWSSLVFGLVDRFGVNWCLFVQ